jgi:predicted metalloendopeptidase
LEIAGALIYPAAMLRKYLVALSIALAVAGAARAEPRSGIDISAIDPTVPPQQDFWQFANGKWLAATPIPADRSAWITFAALYETTQQQLREIEGIDRRRPDDSEPRKLADFYGSFVDEARVEATGLEALRDELARIHGLNDKAVLPALFAHLARLWVRTPWQLDIEPDQHDATHYVAHLEQSRLGLPDRDYYPKDDAHFLTIRKAYREHIVKLLSLAGEPAAEASADGIIALETAIARMQWTRVENRDPIKTYN